MTGALEFLSWMSFGAVIFVVLDALLQLLVDRATKHYDPLPKCQCFDHRQ